MSLPRGSLGFLNAKAERRRGIGRIGDRLWLGRPDRRQLALSDPEGDDRDRASSDAQPRTRTKYGAPAHARSAGNLPWRRQRWADVSDELSLDHHPDPL
jgi:hypothetical protein